MKVIDEVGSYKSPEEIVDEEWIEKNVETFIALSGGKDILAKMFGIPPNRAGLVTQEELLKIKLFVKTVSRDICIKYSDSYNNGIELSQSDYVWNLMSSYLIHDVCHAIQYSSIRSADDGKQTHSFLRDDQLVTEGLVKMSYVEEELFLSIFNSTSSRSLPVSLSITLPYFDNHLLLKISDPNFDGSRREVLTSACGLDLSDFNNYVYKFIVVAMYMPDLGQALGDTKTSLEALTNSKDDMVGHVVEYYKEKIRSRLGIYEGIIAGDVDGDIIDLLHYVWSNRDSGRVLLDLFFMLTEDFYKKLDEKYATKS